MILTKHKDLSDLLRTLDIITAALLLTGQVTITGIFFQTGGAFGIPVSGPITGGFRIESRSKSKLGNVAIDIIDILLAIFLLSDLINVQGTYFTAGRFNIVIGGPLFGGAKTEASDVDLYATDFKRYLNKKK